MSDPRLIAMGHTPDCIVESEPSEHMGGLVLCTPDCPIIKRAVEQTREGRDDAQ